MTLRALLFDVDGTLVDTNEAHVLAWLEAFAAFKFRVGHDRVAAEIGKGGDLLVPAVLGEDADILHGDEMRKAHDEAYLTRIEREGVQLFPGAAEVLSAARGMGLRTAIATSAKRKDLDAIERLIGRSFASMVDVIATGDDVTVSKPAPHVVEAACAALGEDPLACAMIGDSIHDAGAARMAGAAFIGVRSGFASKEDFVHAGARYIAHDIERLRASLPEALAAASPNRVVLDGETINRMMTHAIFAARTGMDEGEAPIGAALFDAEGALLAIGHNQARETGDVTSHAEIDALRRAAEAGHPPGAGAVLVSTLEPCVMCLGAAMEIGLDVVIFGLEAPADRGSTRLVCPRSPENLLPRIRGGVQREESRALFREWLTKVGTPAQRPYVEQLLAETDDAKRAA